MKSNKKANKQLITEKWAPMIQRTTGVKDTSKLEWMSELAHNTAKFLNENSVFAGTAQGGVTSPYATLYNTPGVGNVVAPGQAAHSTADYLSGANMGSGDKYPALLPLALKVAAKTIGFDLVNTVPMSAPTGVLPYMDYVYAGSRQPYGATPGFDKDHMNMGAKNGVPHAFKATWRADFGVKYAIKNAGALVAGTVLKSEDEKTVLEFIGYSRVDGDLMFKVVKVEKTLSELFSSKVELTPYADAKATTALTFKVGEKTTVEKFELVNPRLVSMLEDQLQGFAGSGANDNDPWQGTYQDGMTLYNPMTRGTGEQTAARQLSLQLFTKNIQVGTITVGCSVTQEMVTDLNKQWGIDVAKMVENAGVTELTNTINRHITSALFGLGWKNQVKLVEVEGQSANLNISFADADKAGSTPAYALPTRNDFTKGASDLEGYADNFAPYADKPYVNVALPFRGVTMPEAAAFENRDTLLKRVASNIMLASNWIQQRGRYGAATFVVTNITVATALQSNAHYTFSPVDNTLNQAGGQLYAMGTLCGMTVYVDPNMAANDCRVLVGRKGTDKSEPGLVFMPYVLADSVSIIAEGTMAQKLMIKSRYALACAGWFPETQYMTFCVDFAGVV